MPSQCVPKSSPPWDFGPLEHSNGVLRIRLAFHNQPWAEYCLQSWHYLIDPTIQKVSVHCATGQSEKGFPYHRWIYQCHWSNWLHPHCNKITIIERIQLRQQERFPFYQCAGHLWFTFGFVECSGQMGHESFIVQNSSVSLNLQEWVVHHGWLIGKWLVLFARFYTIYF
jgi:hypothetical protein